MEEKQEDMRPGMTGLIALIRVFQDFGIEVKPNEFIEAHAQYHDKLTIEELASFCKEKKLVSEVIRPTEEELREIAVPTIALMNNGCFVILAVNNDDVVFLIDPRYKKPIALPRKKFLEGWHGEVIVFSTKYNWDYFKKKYNLPWFMMVMKHYKRELTEVLIGAFFLQLMGIGMPLITQVIIDKVIGSKGFSTLTVIGCSMVLFFLVQSLLTGLKTYILNHTTVKLDAILGSRLLRQLISLPLTYYESHRVGDIIMRINFIGGIREFLTGQGLMTALDVMFSFVYIAFMFWFSIPLTLITLCIIPLFVIENYYVVPIYKKKMEAAYRTMFVNNSFAIEAVTNVETIKALAVEPQFNHKWETLGARLEGKFFDVAKFNLVMSGCTNIIQTIISMSVLWYGGHLVMDGYLTLGQLIAYQMISGQAMGPMTKLLTMWPQLQMTGMALEGIGDILNTRMEPIFMNYGKIANQRLAGNIDIKDLNFRYRLDLPLVLKDINLSVKSGEKIGIVGRSGSGKSTLTNLVQNLYQPDAGSVSIDGLDIREANIAWLRGQIGVVMQENYLFNASVRDNIAINRPTATMDEVIAAAKLAGANDFILELKEGYDTKVGERGASLSGGQRQRVAIARALLSNPPILIFDEATSALDYESESIIMHNLDDIGKNRTMLIIAHRLSTVKRCDKIVVIDKGEIIEMGSHDELMAAKGHYWNLYSQQEEGVVTA